ncbi:hypothetical protein JG688_00007269 [Phytophthora aleatoria]|uniref:Uncharacterized protein n=1 Tax=Phytophthora aleatoria TaxID=2496075 RepID=A0A8J5IPL9_9STRA|nr:hypothetical protein JG688_00007269 [Phytophthora aleatoria]
MQNAQSVDSFLLAEKTTNFGGPGAERIQCTTEKSKYTYLRAIVRIVEWPFRESVGNLFTSAFCKLETTNGEAITALLSALESTAMKFRPFGRLINVRPHEVSYFYGTTWRDWEVCLRQLGICDCVPNF